MLTELCAEIRNYFLRDPRRDIHVGNFVISGGSIEPLSFLQDGQYFRIVGSVFNDGVHQYRIPTPTPAPEVNTREVETEQEQEPGTEVTPSVSNESESESTPALTDEVFSGAVWAMAVPPAVIALSQEIDAWIAANREALDSPYQSESFGGYSYSKSSVGSGTGGTGAYGWQVQFSNRLNPYRRVSVL